MAAQQNKVTVYNNQVCSLQAFMNNSSVQNQLTRTLGSEAKKSTFVSSIVSAFNSNNALCECDYQTVLSGALLGNSLELAPSPMLGNYYLVPFNDKKRGKVAQFILGYKGYIQLAIRSGQYKNICVVPIKECEFIKYNRLTEQLSVKDDVSDEDLENSPTIGYYAMFELVNGFTKSIYWSKEKMVIHADKYSSAFHKDAYEDRYGNKIVSYADYIKGAYDPKDEWRYSSFWYKDFDGMAMKTMLRQLISKWGIMSVELQSAYEHDNSFSDEVTNNPTPNFGTEVIDAEVTESKPQPQVEKQTVEIPQMEQPVPVQKPQPKTTQQAKSQPGQEQVMMPLF